MSITKITRTSFQIYDMKDKKWNIIKCMIYPLIDTIALFQNIDIIDTITLLHIKHIFVYEYVL